MLKYLLPLVLVISTSPANAQYIRIAPTNHVPNLKPGYCGYASLETIGRHRGYPQLHGLTAAQVRQSPGYGATTTGHLKRICNDRGVPSTYQTYGTHDYKAVQKGAVVTLLPDRPGNMAHAVVVLGLDNKTTYLYDPNFPGRTTTMPRADFARRWAGNAVVIHPVRSPGNEPR